MKFRRKRAGSLNETASRGPGPDTCHCLRVLGSREDTPWRGRTAGRARDAAQRVGWVGRRRIESPKGDYPAVQEVAVVAYDLVQRPLYAAARRPTAFSAFFAAS